VTNADVSAVRDADRIIGIIEAEQKGPPKLIINRINPQMIKRGDMINTDDVLELLAIKLLGVVPEDEQVIVSTNIGRPIVLDEKSRAGQAFKNIARRLMGDDIPLLDMDYRDDIFHRLSKVFRSGGE